MATSETDVEGQMSDVVAPGENDLGAREDMAGRVGVVSFKRSESSFGASRSLWELECVFAFQQT